MVKIILSQKYFVLVMEIKSGQNVIIVMFLILV